VKLNLGKTSLNRYLGELSMFENIRELILFSQSAINTWWRRGCPVTGTQRVAKRSQQLLPDSFAAISDQQSN